MNAIRRDYKKAWHGGLTDKEAERIHTLSLDILAKVGFRLADADAQRLFREAGSDVDTGTGIVKVPRETVEWALAQCPSKLARYSLNGDPYTLRGDRIYHCTGTHRINVLDHGSRSYRRATCVDLERMLRVADALPGIISVSPCVTPIDAPEGPVDLVELDLLFSNTAKHIYNSPTTAEEARRTLDLAEIVSGESLTRKAMVTIRDGPNSPLVLSADTAQIIITSARRGAILALGSACTAGTLSPVTLAGTLLMQNAEFLFTLTLTQLARPGTAVDYQVSDTVADLRTGLISYGATEMTLLTAGLKTMAEHYSVPFSANQSTDSPWIDVDNGLQKMLHFAYKMAIGVNFLRNAGDLGRANIMSLEQMVIDHEIGKRVERFWEGIKLDEETLAYGTIADVGPGGVFLTHDHTLRHCRDGEHYPLPLKYLPGSDGPTLSEWAHQTVEEILQKKPSGLPGEKAEELRLYIYDERRGSRRAQ